MADLTDAQRKRAEARQRRRSQSDDAPDEPEPSADGGGEEAHHAVKQAAKVAAAVGAAGAAAAAAKALTSHADDEVADRLEPEEPASESEEPQQPEQPDEQTEQEPEQAAEEPVAGAGTSEARQVIDRAREQLQDLLERPVESVSSLERTHDGWVAQLEVVELKRVPESTDVLASYELELDDELNLRRYQQARRYTRSQSSRGEGP